MLNSCFYQSEMVYGLSEKNKIVKNLILLAFFLLGFIPAKSQTADRIYIDKYKDLAVRQMKEHGIPASVILAVAMHESASGTSKIARYLNNHFGIKGRNRVKTIRSSYKSYDSVDNSYEDFIRLMKEKPGFSKLFKQYPHYDYKNWVRGIQRGGYAHSKTWGSQVRAFIVKYKLYEYDDRPADWVDSPSKEPVNSSTAKIYRVKNGDTLSGIAKKLGTSVKQLMNKNGLKTSKIKPGQRLKY